jgi:DNA replication initiation complex subunit (GINS family)
MVPPCVYIFLSIFPIFGEKYSEYLNLTEEEKKLFVNLMDIIHSMRYERNEEDEDKNPYKTTKRNPFWVYPKSRSGDNNIFAETEIELYRSKEEKPKLQTAALAFLLMEAIF